MAEAARTTTPEAQLFRDVFNASPIGIVVENFEGQPLFVNPAFCSFLGFSEQELRDKHCVDFSPREDAEKDWALFQQLKAGLIDHYQLEKRYFQRDGSLIWGRLSISLLNSRSSPLVIAMVEDITYKKRAEEVLRRHSAIVESSEDAIGSVTPEGVIASWNAGAQRIFGYSESEVVGKPVTILVPPERPDEENQILETLKAGGRIDQLETVRVTKTGERIHVSVSIFPIKDSAGNTVAFSGITRDITERKRAEQALLESEERLRLAAQAGRMFAYSWDAATDIIERSGEATEILGIRNQEAATGSAIAAMVHPDDRERLEAALAKLSIENPVLRITYRFIRPDGAVTWLERNSRAYFDTNGSVKRIVGMIVDITDRKIAKAALAEMTRKLIEAQEQERTRIARELHDDVNQRLAMLSLELAQLRDNPSEVESRVPDLRRQITEISNDVQELSHDLHPSKLEYLGVVGGLKSWCQEFAARQRFEIDFRSDVSSHLPRELGVSLLRVLQEALHNATKYSGVKRIEVELREDSGGIHLTIRDSGKGFDIETALKGNGLGLTSMQERVRLLGGTISIDSKPLGGTTIHARVPFESEQGSELAG